MRFISISHRTQIFISLGFVSVLLWSVLTSYSYMQRANILAHKDRELATAEKNYADANDQFSKLKNNIQKSTIALEQRQIYLQQLMDEDKSLSENILPKEQSTNVDKALGGSNDTEQKSKFLPLNISYSEDDTDIHSKQQQQLANLHFNISRIEQQQQKLAEKMIAHISSKIDYVEYTLNKSGIKSKKLIQLAENRPSMSMAMGGPFILYSENFDIDFSNSEPFAKLYSHYNRLIDLESAVRHIPIGKPAKKYYISSSFGIRKDPFKKKWARHQGIDMAGWWDTPIYASANGTVLKAGVNGAYGKFIEIDHGNGFRSRYGHLSKIKVKKGEQVTLEQEIGLMGSTGRSTSPHLHYEIWFNGKPINPMKIFKAADNVLKIQRQEYDS
ncbi:MAG: hypothetical protein COA93_05605 [Alphaproteobacteria bacterium]|nr:MAG: hypothetical protein COA93_05605 [Alphaproteobacteria bacterium]